MSYRRYLKNILKHTFDIFQFVIGNKMLWSNSYQRKYIKSHWGDVASKPDFADKFLGLVKGMDAQSIRTVIRILARHKTILDSNSRFLDLFTTDEQRELRELKENFNDVILRLSDDLFVYKNYFLPTNRFGQSALYYKHGIDKVETIARVKGKTIIDAGGYIGDSVLVFEELGPDKIYTFEPSPDNYDLMKKTIELNGLKNVVAENVAVGAEKGECSLYMAETASFTDIINRSAVPYRKEIKVPIITLDDYVTEHKIDNIGLIKTDIEGAEPDFLAGARKTICDQKPILMLSIYHNPHDFFELKPLIESWNLGYRFKIYKPTIQNTLYETFLIAEIV